jgi:HD-GYP domain-containing protein (c-di-GMP phosphodiesterase class II)
MPFEQVMEIITKEAGHQFDPKVVKALLTVLEWRAEKAA